MHLNRPPPRLVATLALVVVMSALVSGPAAAHVKWFCGPVDVSVPPLGLGTVLSPTFLSRGVTFLMLVAAGGCVDALLARRWPRRGSESRRVEIVGEWLIRLGIGGYALCLWRNAAVVPWGAAGDGAILTPELLDLNGLVNLAQFAVAVLSVFRRTCPLAGLGLAALYTVGIARYGIFHMTDYVYFLGLAGYLVLSAPRLDGRPDLRGWRVPLLTASLSFSLMWTAIEKFLYPAFTAAVLAGHPNLTFGFPMPFVTLIAGFVEFSLAFYLLVGRSLLRLDALLLIGVFVSAIPEFGTMDAVGHLPIIVILVVVVIHGATPLQDATRPEGAGPVRSAAALAGLYVVALAVMMALYYGLQHTAARF